MHKKDCVQSEKYILLQKNKTMNLEITGKLLQVLPEQTGTGKNGTWVKQEFLLEIADDQFPKKICFSLWGEKTQALKSMQPGTTLKVSFNVESREYNGKWFTDARAWKLEKLSGSETPAEPSMAAPPEYSVSDLPPEKDDLPF